MLGFRFMSDDRSIIMLCLSFLFRQRRFEQSRDLLDLYFIAAAYFS